MNFPHVFPQLTPDRSALLAPVDPPSGIEVPDAVGRNALPNLFLRSQRALDVAESLARDIHQGIWLGVLSRDALHTVDERFYDTNGRYQDPSHNLQGLFGWERRAVEDHFQNCKSVAVIGAGAGREVLALATMGIEVTGFECHPHLTAQANRLLESRGCSARVSLLPRDAAPTGIFDGMIVGWGVYTLIQGRKNREEFLRSVSACVPVGAPILLSYFQRTAGSRRYRIVSRIGNVVRRLSNAPAVEEGDRLVPNFSHAFTLEEVTAEIRASGLEIVEQQRQPYPHTVALKQGPSNHA